jgi:hypothetical protein
VRYVLAFTSLALAAVFAILGVGQVTFLSGPSSLRAPLATESDIHYSVISSDVLLSQPGQASLVIEGKGVAFAGYGSSRDVQAWVAPYEHQLFSLDTETNQILSENIAGVTPEAIPKAAEQYPADATDFKNPAGSDLWLGEVVGDEKLTLFTDATEDTSVIFASNGMKPQPAMVELAWIQPRSAPWFGPLMVLAGFFAVLGLFFYLLAVDHDKRKTGPRRGRNKPFQGIRDIVAERREEFKQRQAAKKNTDHSTLRSASKLAVLVVTSSLVLSGCSANYWPSMNSSDESSSASPSATPEPEPSNGEVQQAALPPVPVSEPALKGIVAKIATVAAEADVAASTELAQQRFVGSALAQRDANYKIRGKVPETPLPLSITSQLVGYNLIQSTDGWPRTILASTNSSFPEGQEPPVDENGIELKSPVLALVMKQESPYSNYLVQSVIEVRGGVVFPEAAAVEKGVAVLPKDSKTLVLAPNQVGLAFGEILAQGEAAPSYALFDVTDEPLLEQLGQAWVAKAQAEAAERGESVEYSIEMGQADDVVALSTGAGGALVSVTINEKHIARSTQERGSVKLTPSVEALSGLSGSKRSVYQLWQSQMLFFVPNAESGEKIRILGSTTAMTGAGEG